MRSPEAAGAGNRRPLQSCGAPGRAGSGMAAGPPPLACPLRRIGPALPALFVPRPMRCREARPPRHTVSGGSPRMLRPCVAPGLFTRKACPPCRGCSSGQPSPAGPADPAHPGEGSGPVQAPPLRSCATSAGRRPAGTSTGRTDRPDTGSPKRSRASTGPFGSAGCRGVAGAGGRVRLRGPSTSQHSCNAAPVRPDARACVPLPATGGGAIVMPSLRHTPGHGRRGCR